MMGEHYANAFTVTPGQCFRMVIANEAGHPTHCPEPVTVRGRWRSAANKVYRVDACDGHADELDAAVARPAPPRRGQ